MLTHKGERFPFGLPGLRPSPQPSGKFTLRLPLLYIVACGIVVQVIVYIVSCVVVSLRLRYLCVTGFCAVPHS